MKGTRVMEKVKTAQLTSAKKPTKKEIKNVVIGGIKTNELEDSMVDIIIRDIFNANKEKAETLLTKELNRVYEEESPEFVTSTKKWVKTRLQTIVKAKTVQMKLLGEDTKNKIVTIKKINNGVLNGDKCLNRNLFSNDDLGKFKVVLEAKKVAEPKTFEEELLKLMEKHEKYAHDLISFLKGQLSPAQIMEELETEKVV